MSETKTGLVEFNLNQIIRVRLTDLGYKLLSDLHNSYIGSIPDWEYRTPEYFQGKADEEGYTQFQAWDFMAKFGSVIFITGPQYFHLDILLDVKS